MKHSSLESSWNVISDMTHYYNYVVMPIVARVTLLYFLVGATDTEALTTAEGVAEATATALGVADGEAEEDTSGAEASTTAVGDTVLAASDTVKEAVVEFVETEGPASQAATEAKITRAIILEFIFLFS